MTAFIVSILITAAMLGAAVWVARRRVPGTPLSWGEAFVAATFVFGVLFMAYGVVPHQWLTWADNELNWRRDVYFFGENGVTFFGRGRIMVPKEAVRDIIAIGIYGVFLVGNVLGWLWWQRRGQRRPDEAAVSTSPYGRPVLRKL